VKTQKQRAVQFPDRFKTLPDLKEEFIQFNKKGLEMFKKAAASNQADEDLQK